MLLGSGELGKEFTIAAKRAGQYVIACDKYDNAPAMQVADEREVFSMLDGDALTAVVEKHHPDVIVPEIEAIRTERLFDFEKEGIQVVPSARAVNYTMNRRAIRDLAAKELGLRTAKYFYAKTFEEFKNAADEIGFPCVVKPLMSSSGHGQSYVHNDDELKEAYKEAMAKFHTARPQRKGRGGRQLSEQERMIQKYHQLEQDIVTYENNIGFFAMSKNSEPLIKQMQERIAQAKVELNDLAAQIRALKEAETQE
mgnify:CR=1 FL=1